jgi:hypothetical protein
MGVRPTPVPFLSGPIRSGLAAAGKTGPFRVEGLGNNQTSNDKTEETKARGGDPPPAGTRREWHEPPLLFLPEEEQELFEELPQLLQVLAFGAPGNSKGPLRTSRGNWPEPTHRRREKDCFAPGSVPRDHS